MDYRVFARGIQEFLLVFQFKGFTEQLIINLREDSFFPELPRKAKFTRVLDNIAWYLRHGEVNRYYNSYGFDVRGLRKQSEYLARNQFRRKRNNLNLRVSAFGYTMIGVLRDKSVFSAYMSASLGPRRVLSEIAWIQADGQIRICDREHPNIEPSLKSLLTAYGDLFIKQRDGECGESCYLVEAPDLGADRISVNGQPETLEAFCQRLRGSSFLVQRRLKQHAMLAELNPSCVNTLRIITIIGKASREPRIFASFLRLGVNSPVDNRTAGGMAVLVDENGVLHGKGFGHHEAYERHPVTGVCFEGYVLPFWEEVTRLVVNAHRAISSVPAIGWDVAILPDGPILVEGNDNWEICGVQDTMGGAKKRWKQFVDR